MCSLTLLFTSSMSIDYTRHTYYASAYICVWNLYLIMHLDSSSGFCPSYSIFYVTSYYNPKNDKNKINIIVTLHINNIQCNTADEISTNNKVKQYLNTTINAASHNTVTYIIILLNPDNRYRLNWEYFPYEIEAQPHPHHHQYPPIPHGFSDPPAQDIYKGSSLHNRLFLMPIRPRRDANHIPPTRNHGHFPPLLRWTLVPQSLTHQHLQYLHLEELRYPDIHLGSPSEILPLLPYLHPIHKLVTRYRYHSLPPPPNDTHWILLPTIHDEFFHDEGRRDGSPSFITTSNAYAFNLSTSNNNNRTNGCEIRLPTEYIKIQTFHISITSNSNEKTTPLRGGGQKSKPELTNSKSTINFLQRDGDIISISSASLDSSYDWQTQHPGLEINKLINDHTPLHEMPWQPDVTLPWRQTTHSLVLTIPTYILSSIKKICNLHPTMPLIRSSRSKTTFITTDNLRDLVSYGTETNDSIITLYMEMLCHNDQATYMYPTFLTKLKQHGWAEVSRFFATSSHGYYARKVDRPNKVGEPRIMIPLFVNGSHWVALVRRELQSKVYFFYSDDMNQSNTEEDIKTLIFHHTDKDFCPPDAQWVHCLSTFYINHSNECGPRTLLALHVMAFHPFPHQNMLLPLMDDNIAQISRTWIAASLLLGRPLHESLAPTFLKSSFLDTRSSSTLQSDPYDIIPWDARIDNVRAPQFVSLPSKDGNVIEGSLFPHAHIPPCSSTTGVNQSTQHVLLLETHSLECEKTDRSYSSPNHNIGFNYPNIPLEIGISHKSHEPKGNGTLTQTKLTEWIPCRTSHDDMESLQSADTLIQGSMLPQIDPTNTIRIIMQNTQHSLQLTNNKYNSIQLTRNLKEAHTAIFAAISPNINWHNPSHKIQFKYPFTRMFQQTHISAVSSDVGKLPNYIYTPTLVGGAAIITLEH